MVAVANAGGTFIGDDDRTNGEWPGVRRAFDEMFQAPGMSALQQTAGRLRRDHVPLFVMARLVRATCSSTCAATGGPDEPGHDDVGTLPTIGQVSDFAIVSEMCASHRDTPYGMHTFRKRTAKSKGCQRVMDVPTSSWPGSSGP